MAKFRVTYDMQEKGLPTLFKYQIFTITSDCRKDWNYDELEHYLGEYEFRVSDEVRRDYAEDAEVTDVLEEMMQDKCGFVVDNNKAKRYSGRNQYIKCTVPMYVLRHLKKLFVSTLVYDAESMEIPQKEFITFEFDTITHSVSLVDMQLYRPKDNPYYTYAKHAVSSLSVEAIGLEKYSLGAEKKVNDFYDLRFVTGWKEVKQLSKEKGIEDKAGVYMLYDANSNQYYVGKANNLKERILQHQRNTTGNDPIPNFTHYRYSAISGEYYEFLYLIENAAIHDSAWLFSMSKAKQYKPSLGEKIAILGKSLDDIVMVNFQEHQTRKNSRNVEGRLEEIAKGKDVEVSCNTN